MDDVPNQVKNPGPYKNHWFKPIGDVYRSSPQDRFYPTQGIAISDTRNVQVIKDNHFYDFYSDRNDAHRNAIGINYASTNPVSPKNCFVADQTFTNTPNRIEMGFLKCNEPNCDQYSFSSAFGRNFGSPVNFRDLGDGEKSMGYIDLTGQNRIEPITVTDSNNLTTKVQYHFISS